MTDQELNKALFKIEQYGKNKLDPDFRIYPEDHTILEKLIAWSLRDKERADVLEIKLDKGLMLSGPVGCGKTSMLKAIRCLITEERYYGFKTAAQVSYDFQKEAYGVISKLSSGSVKYFGTEREQVIHLCFDDLGFEPETVWSYGSKCNVMEHVLTARFDYFEKKGMMTHLTTNLKSIEIEKRYGKRVRSRMRSMFNLITFPNDAKDKRT